MLHQSPVSCPEIEQCFSRSAWIREMIRFESALASASAEEGVVPQAAADSLVELLDTVTLPEEWIEDRSRSAGNPAIPFVTALTDALPEGPGRSVLHYGATSQDVIDTAMMLMVSRSLAVLEASLGALGDRLAEGATAYRDGVMPARTLLQQAGPQSVGLMFAQWLDPIIRLRADLTRLRAEVPTLQLGGATGSFSVLGVAGPQVAKRTASILGLAWAPMPWHGARDRGQSLVAWCGRAVSAAAKPARDISILMMTETGEVRERGAGGSTTLPHKRNPVASLPALAAQAQMGGLLAASQASSVGELQRAAGAWHGEWALIPQALELAGAALSGTGELLNRLEVDTVRMEMNLEATKGLLFAERLSTALSVEMGRSDAKALVERLCRESGERHLKDTALGSSVVTAALGKEEIEDLFNAKAGLGAYRSLIDDTVRFWNPDD